MRGEGDLGRDAFSYFEYFANEMWRMKREHDPAHFKGSYIELAFEEPLKKPEL